jgi:adenylate cyclase
MRRVLQWLLRSTLIGLLCWLSAEVAVRLSETMVKPPLRGLENQLIDLAFQIRTVNPNFTMVGPDQVVIIDIDDASIAALGRPQLWPRLYDARAIAHVAKGNPFAIGVDYLYTEPDLMPAVYTDMLRQKGVENPQKVLEALRSDDTLAAVIADVGNIYLAFFDDDQPIEAKNAYPDDLPLRRIADSGASSHIPRLINPQLPIDQLNRAARANATIAMPSEQDGTIRQYQLISILSKGIGSGAVANFPFYMVTDGYGFADDELELRNDGVYAANRLLMPLNKEGQFRINWAGELDEIRYISFFKVVQELVPPEFFSDKFVFFGTSASGMQDLKTVPCQADKMPGVEVHVHAFLTMVNGAWINELTSVDVRWWFVLIAIALAMLQLLLRPLAGFMTAAALTVAELIIFVGDIVPNRSVVFPIATLMIITLLSHVIAALFIYFVRERRVRKLRSAFAAYVPKEVVKRIAQDPKAVKLGGQRMELSVLFSDIRGFTSYSEQLSPEEVVRFLNEYLSVMSTAIFNEKGTIDKFIGDAIMAIFGAPVPDRTHAVNACSAALGMRNALREFNARLNASGKPSVAMGAGINTGEMTVGNIGSQQRFNYTVIGDAVNVASRLESLTKFFGVELIVSEHTYRQCPPESFVFRPLGKVRVKGRVQALAVYELCGKNGDPSISIDLSAWQRALDLLYSGDANAALAHFEEFARRHPHDGASEPFIDLCNQVRDTGKMPVFTPEK